MNRSQMKHIYIFDLDDTLYCEHDYVKSGFKAVSNHLSQNYAEDSEIYEKWMVNFWQENGRGKVFDKLCQEFSISEEIQSLVDVYRAHIPGIELYSDAKKCLNHLKESRQSIGLITDGSTLTQWNKIKELQLEKFIDTLIVSDDLGGSSYWKPHAKPYLEAAKQLGVDVSQCCYVGDNPNKDFITAKKLGMKTVRIKREIGDHMNTLLADEYEADINISSLVELIEYDF
ncbi:putative hydrolase [Bacillus sp. TS-2]|nr:putative hydrolase [Bacillus sp. TS-2]